MRIDLYLSTTGLIKRRTIAREFCDSGKVTLNDKAVKPSKEIAEGDIIGLRLSSGYKSVEVTDIPRKNLRKGEGENYYIIKEFQPRESRKREEF
ncbi:MAG: RNA-binding S4 domain-containing protein [candidate division Zixibacteria bacterium]|nr:RNA-binding S4 domain-containing protein [candidate division Zixibacteria bacterium]